MWFIRCIKSKTDQLETFKKKTELKTKQTQQWKLANNKRNADSKQNSFVLNIL